MMTRRASAVFSGKGQVSVEYLGITAFFILMAGLFFAYAFSVFSENKNLVLGQDAAAKIADNANLAASLGNGSQIQFEVELPDTVSSVVAFNRIVYVNYASSVGSTSAYAYAKANITPLTLQVSQGRRTMTATFSDGNVVIG